MKDEQNYFSGLDKYGKVEQNEKKDGMYFVKITDGFIPKARVTMDLLKSILDQIKENNIVIVKFLTNKDLYELVLRPKQ